MSLDPSKGGDLLDSNRLLYAGINSLKKGLDKQSTTLNSTEKTLKNTGKIIKTLNDHFSKLGSGLQKFVDDIRKIGGLVTYIGEILENKFLPSNEGLFQWLKHIGEKDFEGELTSSAKWASTMLRDLYRDFDIMGARGVKNYFWDLGKLEDISSQAEDELTKPLKLFGESFPGKEHIQSLKETFGTMSKKKFIKGAKAVGGAFSSMMGASLQAWAMQQLMKLIEPFMMLLKPFEPLFTVLGGILKKTLAPIVVELTKGMMVLVKPMIEVIGLIWGNSPGLIPGFKLMWNIGKKVVDVVLFPFKFWMELLLGLWNGGVKGLVDGFLGFFDEIGILWDNSVKAIFDGIADFLDWVSGLNPANWGGGGGGGSTKKEDQWWDPLNWFGPDMYAFNSPQVIGVGDEGQTEYLMREDKLRGLLGGTANTELVRNSRDQVYLLENIDRNIRSERRWID